MIVGNWASYWHDNSHVIYKDMVRILLMSAFCFWLGACEAQVDDNTNVNAPLADGHLAYIGEPGDEYSLVRDDLYTSSDGQLYFKTRRVGVDTDEADLATYEDVYLKRFGYYDSDVPKRRDDSLTQIIDPESWRQVYFSIYGDADKLYCTHDLSSGARLYRLEGYSPSNTRFIYVRNGVVANQFAFNVSPESDLSANGWYISNGETYFDYRCRAVSESVLKAQLRAQVTENPPDYSKEKAQPIK